jgi:hypothetical protein
MRRSGLSSTFEALQKWGDYPAFLWSCRFSSFRVLFLNWAGHIHSITSILRFGVEPGTECIYR